MSELPDDWSSQRYALAGTVRPPALGVNFWSATDRETDDRVMIKAMSRTLLGGPGSRLFDSFAAEGRAVAALQHPSILRLLDHEVTDAWVFHVYELAGRETLADVLAAQRIGSDRALIYGLQLAEALAFLHDRGLVHGYAHPANIVTGVNDQLKLSGFNYGWEWVGSYVPAYSAPEYVRDRALTARSDVYMFGAVLWEMLVGQPYFQGAGASRDEVLAFHASASFAALDTLVPDAPRWLRRLVRACLSAEPAARPASMEDVCIEFEGRTGNSGLDALIGPLRPMAALVFPRPVRVILGDLHHLRSPALAALRLLDLCEVMIKLAAVAAIGVGGAGRAELPDQPSLGHWCAVLRGNLAALGTDAPTAFRRFESGIAEVRNRYKGHGALGHDGVYEEMLQRYAPEYLDVLATTPLFSRMHWEGAVLFYGDTAVSGSGLCTLSRCETCGGDEVFLFNGDGRTRRSYLSYETGHLRRVPRGEGQ